MFSVDSTERSRRVQYDRVTSDLLRKIETEKTKGHELQGQWSEFWEETLELLYRHIQPIAQLYMKVDLGGMREFVCKEASTPTEMVGELTRHSRSFVDFGVPESFNVYVKKLEKITQSVGRHPVKAEHILELIWIVREVFKIIPEELPSAADKEEEEYQINAEDGASALSSLRKGKNEIIYLYTKIIDEINSQLRSCQEQHFHRQNSQSSQFDNESFQSDWNTSPTSADQQFSQRSERNSYHRSEEIIPSGYSRGPSARRSFSGSDSFHSSSRVEGGRGRGPGQGPGLSASATASLPVRPQQFRSTGPPPFRTNSGSGQSLRKSGSDGYNQDLSRQDSWRSQKQSPPRFSSRNEDSAFDNSAGWGGNQSRGSSGRGFSSFPGQKQDRGPPSRGEGSGSFSSSRNSGWGGERSKNFSHNRNEGLGGEKQSSFTNAGDGWGGERSNSFPTTKNEGWGGSSSFDGGKTKTDKKNRKPKLKVEKSRISQEDGWGALEGQSSAGENPWGVPTSNNEHKASNESFNSTQSKFQSAGWGAPNLTDENFRSSARSSRERDNKAVVNSGDSWRGVKESSPSVGGNWSAPIRSSSTTINPEPRGGWGNTGVAESGGWGGANQSAGWGNSVAAGGNTNGNETGWGAPAPTTKRRPPPGFEHVHNQENFGSGQNQRQSSSETPSVVYPPGLGPPDAARGTDYGAFEGDGGGNY